MHCAPVARSTVLWAGYQLDCANCVINIDDARQTRRVYGDLGVGTIIATSIKVMALPNTGHIGGVFKIGVVILIGNVQPVSDINCKTQSSSTYRTKAVDDKVEQSQIATFHLDGVVRIAELMCDCRVSILIRQVHRHAAHANE